MKLDAQIAARIRDECFDEEERLLLSYVEGSTYIDIADQFLHYFPSHILRRSIDETIKSIVITKRKKLNFIFEQIRTEIQERDSLLNPRKYYKEGDSTSNSVTNLINDFTSKNKSRDSTGAFGYSFEESSGNSKSAALARGASTQTSEQNKGIESEWKKDMLISVANQLVGKKEFDPNKVLQEDKILDVREAHYEMIPEERQESIPDDGQRLYSVLNVGLTGNTTSNYGANNAESLSINRSDGVIEAESNTYSNTTYGIHKDYRSFVHNDAVLRVLRTQPIELLGKYFNSFGYLFKAVWR